MIKVFKLINGEDLIGEIFTSYDNRFVIKNPAQIVLQQTQQGVSVALAPYMPFVEGHLDLYRSAITAEGIPKQEMSNEYNRIFGSGIVVAPASAMAGLSK
jgi:hypothetical protein